MPEDDALRTHLARLLDWQDAHASFDVEVQVFYGRPPQPSDLQALEALGVRVLGGMGARGVVYAVAPDAAIPRIAELPRVTNVRAQAMGCAELR